MTFRTVVSRSGTEHLISDPPRFLSGGAALVAGRLQTLCEMHLNEEDIKQEPASATPCRFCLAEAGRRVSEIEQPPPPRQEPPPARGAYKRRR